LAEAAESRFRTLRLGNVSGFVGDGAEGLPVEAPFDRIMVTAAAEAVPPALLEQLRIGGIMVIPVGPELGVQRLVRIVRSETEYRETKLAEVRFVPLIPGKAEHL
jgi:protein-L-isoaspartate(D-aspartate) O-methyltransferase